jgi:hypothetical protein
MYTRSVLLSFAAPAYSVDEVVKFLALLQVVPSIINVCSATALQSNEGFGNF